MLLFIFQHNTCLVFYTTRVDGVLEVWDFLYEQRVPILPVKVADFPLYTLKVQEAFFSQSSSQDYLIMNQSFCLYSVSIQENW